MSNLCAILSFPHANVHLNCLCNILLVVGCPNQFSFYNLNYLPAGRHRLADVSYDVSQDRLFML